MSFQAMTWAIKKKIPTIEKFVLLMIANDADHDCYSDVIVEDLAETVSLSMKQIISHLLWLMDNKYLTYIEAYDFEGKEVTKFKLGESDYEF